MTDRYARELKYDENQVETLCFESLWSCEVGPSRLVVRVGTETMAETEWNSPGKPG
jgi:hypothetical protein